MTHLINHWKTGTALMLGLLASTGLRAQGAPAYGDTPIVINERLLSFEEPQVPDFISATSSQLSINDRHYRDGRHCLSWQYEPGSVLTVKKDLKFEPLDPAGKDLYMSAFIVWVYNDQAADRQIRFEFLKDGKVCTSFPMNINFTGWRGIWLCYERDMEGKPEVGMNEIRITAPGDTGGHLYFDHLLTASKVDPRQQTPDLQVPFVNKNTDSHWLLIYKHSLYKPDIPLEPLTAELKAEMQLVEKRFRDMLYSPGKLTDKEKETIRRLYDFYQISYRDGKVSGVPIFFVRHSEAYERMIPNWDKDMFVKLGMETRAYLDLMKRIATAYLNADNADDREEMKQKFLAMYDNITDQGVAYGSCWGNIHHYGYSVRSLYVSYFLMKNVLREAGKLAEAEKTLRWYAITNEVYNKPAKNGIDIDAFNTQTQGRIASILIMEDTPEKLQYLRSFSRWIDFGCRPADGLMDSFKADGSCYHHCNLYPAYGVGGLDGATDMIYLLSGTDFRISPLAHETVKNALLTMRFYCNTFQWPLAISGRHPNGSGGLIPMHFATMAVAGSPDGSQSIDPEMAAAYLRLAAYNVPVDKNAPDYMPKPSTRREREMREQIESAGFQPEATPQGNLSLPYGCTAVQRRDNWMATARGHSRYIWAAEHYLDANFYGRYLAHGSLQIQTGPEGKPVTFTTSGWQEEGFDWNRIPGATSIHLPFDKLRAVVLNVDTYSGMEEMLYSDEAFAGGLSQARRNGNFGMKLHEHDKYNGSLRARKSYHFLGETIVCLGSDIENTVAQYPTETTVFQLAAITPENRDYWKGISAGRNTYIDPNGVGYYLPKNTLGIAKFERNFPQVTVGERSTKPTSGDWVSLVLEHGNAPKGGRYEYAILPHTDAKALENFAKRPAYKVLQQDRNAHIVRSDENGITSYVLFETPEKLPDGLLQKADTSCLVMVEQQGSKALITVAQPDLALYRGPSDEAFDKDGKRIERSIYSRPWIANASGEIPVTITIKGRWQVEETPFCKVISTDKKQTVLRFSCKDGASYDVELTKK